LSDHPLFERISASFARFSRSAIRLHPGTVFTRIPFHIAIVGFAIAQRGTAIFHPNSQDMLDGLEQFFTFGTVQRI
jgi:hypothetical protein